MHSYGFGHVGILTIFEFSDKQVVFCRSPNIAHKHPKFKRCLKNQSPGRAALVFLVFLSLGDFLSLPSDNSDHGF